MSWTEPFRDDRMTVRRGDVLTALLASFVAYTLYLPIPTEKRSGHPDLSHEPSAPDALPILPPR